MHAVVDVSHDFTFYFDGRFGGQYVEPAGGVGVQNWGTLHKCDLTNANLLVLQSGPSPCAYTDEDIDAIEAFLSAGGGVVLFGDHALFRDETEYHPNAVARAFGAEFTEQAAEAPLAPAAALGADELTYYGGRTVELAEPGAWTVLATDAAGRVVMARRSVGEGSLLVCSRGLCGQNPDASDPINDAVWQPLLRDLARGKTVDPARTPESVWPENETARGGLKIRCSDYMEPYANVIFDVYAKEIPVMEAMLGVPPSEGMMTSLLLLPTGGGGFSSGDTIGLGVFWGGFPDELYGMIELIGHEGTHSWVLPFAEPMWNEPIATYVGALVGVEMGFAEEGRACIERTIENGLKHDPDMTKFDIAYGEDVPNAVHWGKAFWLFEQLRAEKPDFLKRYFQAKRSLMDPAKHDAYTPDDCIAVISAAMERDLFGWFAEHGLTVSPEKTTVPMEW